MQRRHGGTCQLVHMTVGSLDKEQPTVAVGDLVMAFNKENDERGSFSCNCLSDKQLFCKWLIVLANLR